MRSISSSIEALVMRHSSLLLMVAIYRMSGCEARWYLGRITVVVQVWEFARSLRVAFLLVAIFLEIFFVFIVIVLDVVAVVLRGERCAIVGVGDAADAVEGDVHLLDIRGRDLQRIEKEAGALGVDAIGGEGLCDIDEGELDGDGIFERGEIERCGVDSVGIGFGCGDGIGAVVDGAE